MDLKTMGLRGPIRQKQDGDGSISLSALVNNQPIDATTKADLYRAYKEAEEAGDLFKLRVSIVPHIQGDNANFWRILPKAYGKVAKSFSDKVFQRDHSLRQSDRGGTILSSKAKNPKSDDAFMIQEIEVVEPWAIEGFLRGTIDRFSIQLNIHDITAYCSICGASIWDWCAHWPGQKYEVEGKEQMCWWDVHAATGKETSAVTDPAVEGTHIQDMKQLAASIRGPQPTTLPSEEDNPMNLEELQAAMASKEEELAAKDTLLQERDAQVAALIESAEQDVAKFDTLKAELEAAHEELKAAKEATSVEASARDAIHQRLCADLAGQINSLRAGKDLFEGQEAVSFEATEEADLAAEEDSLRRTLLADQILIERDLRHDGPDFDVAAERDKLLAKSADALQLALEQWQVMPLLTSAPPMGKGSALRPNDGARANVETIANTSDDIEEMDDFSAEDLASIITGKADIQ